MLFTVLIISIILALGLGIADTTYKQTILSSLARDSQLAFYQADSGVECGLYYDLYDGNGQLPKDTPLTQVPSHLVCGNVTVALDSSQSATNYEVYTEDNTSSAPCFSITFDKTDPTGKYSVSSRGYSSCTNNPQQVERALNVTY